MSYIVVYQELFTEVEKAAARKRSWLRNGSVTHNLGF